MEKKKSANLFKTVFQLKEGHLFANFVQEFGLDYKTAQGNTLLHLAVIAQNWKFSSYLINQGLSLFEKNKEGNIPGVYLFLNQKDDLKKQKIGKYKKNLSKEFLTQINQNSDSTKDLLDQFFHLEKKKDFNILEVYIHIKQINKNNSGVLNYPTQGYELLKKLEEHNFVYLKDNYYLYFKNIARIANPKFNKTNATLSDNEISCIMSADMAKKAKQLELREDYFLTVLSFKIYQETNLKSIHSTFYSDEQCLKILKSENYDLNFTGNYPIIYDLKKWDLKSVLEKEEEYLQLKNTIISNWEINKFSEQMKSSAETKKIKSFKVNKL